MPDELPRCPCGSNQWRTWLGHIYCDVCGHTPRATMTEEELRKFERALWDDYGRR